jgi:hypothetical protein
MPQCAEHLCALHKFFLTLAQVDPENGDLGTGACESDSVSFKSLIRSNLPSFLLPCPCCGHRMTITAITPAGSNGGAESGNLEDITHGCAQCGTTLTRTVRPLAESDQDTAMRA